MPPKKRVTTASPKKAATFAEPKDSEVMEDIESEGNMPEDTKNASPAKSTPPVARRGRKRKEESAVAAVDEQKKKKGAESAANEAPPTDAEEDAAPPLLSPALDDGEEMEEIIVTKDDEEGSEQLTAVSRKDDESSVAATPNTPKWAAKAAASLTTSAAAAKEFSTPSRRVPRLKLEQELSEDVKKAQEIEDERERDEKPARAKTGVLRRPTSPPRTRGFTSAATLSATMKESKERLKRTKREPKEEGETAGEIDVETAGETVTDGNSEETNTCNLCSLRFPLHLEMVEHQLAAHRKQVRHPRDRGGTLMCAHPHCGLSLKDMHHQLAHLAGYHNQTQYRIRQKPFASEEAFMAWKTESEMHAKSNYIARNEELEIEPGVTELELYCECSEEWRNADKNKSLAPMLACPAHFTVRLDRNKNKVLIIGCFSHLGHLKKPNWSVLEPSEMMIGKKSSGMGHKESKCHLCGEWFRSRTALTIHRRTTHPDQIRTATIACGDPSCDVVTDTMLSLCEHVVDAHKREDLTIEEYRFNSIDDFEVWKERMEADTMSYFTKVSGRQRAAPSGPNSDCFFRYYQCHLSGYNQRPSQKKNEDLDRIKIRNRGTKKMNRFCTAFMNIKINDADGSVLLKGCLGHFGHDCDIRRVPMPNSLRAEIVKLLQQGITEDDVLAVIKDKSSQHDRGYYLQKYEVKNIVKKMIKESNGELFYKYDDEMEEMGEEDEIAQWQDMKRPFSSAMYRSMINHPKRIKMGTYAMQFANNLQRKRRLVYRQADEHDMHEGEEYFENVVEEMAADMDEHVTYLDDEVEMDPSSHHHMVHEGDEHQEDGEHHEMQDEMDSQASTSAAHLVGRRKLQSTAVYTGALVQPTQQRQMKLLHAAAGRPPLLKDGSGRDRHLDFTINNIRRKIMYMTEQVKRCKDPEMSNQMLDEVRGLERRIAQFIPQTGGSRMDSLPPQFTRRGEEMEEDEEYYDENVVEDEGEYYEMDDGRPGPSSIVVPRGVQRAYGHHEVIYQDVGSPGVEVDVEDLEEMVEEDDVIDQMEG